MPNPEQQKRYPLHIHIATLFAILVLLVGVTLAWVSYRQISNLTFDTTETLFSRTIDHLELQFQKEYRPVATSVRLLANADIADAGSLEERMQHLPILAEVIRDNPQIASIGVGYDNGDYFVMRPLASDDLRSAFAAPAEAVFVVDNISRRDSSENRQVRIFLAAELEPVGEAVYSQTDFDPRSRPWYQTMDSALALKITSPYRFFFSRKIGITVSRLSDRGRSTVAADITLDSLSEILRKNRITPSTFSLIFNADEQVLSHSTPGGSPFGDLAQDEIPRLADLPQSLTPQLRMLTGAAGEVVPFVYDGNQWFGTVRDISTQNRLDIKLLIAAPERELLASAFEVRNTSILIIAGVVLLTLPVAWIFANQIARPLRKLSAEARAIAEFDFDHPLGADSIVLEVQQLSAAMESMRVTIGNFFRLITSLSAESDIDRLLDRVTDETMRASGAGAAVIYLLSDDETQLVAQAPRLQDGSVLDAGMLTAEAVNQSGASSLLEAFHSQQTRVEVLEQSENRQLSPLFAAMQAERITAVILPLADRNDEASGLLCLLYSEQGSAAPSPERIGFAQALSGFTAVSMESRQLLKMQKALLQSFIEVIASAIDAKSPYTSGHCQRVPELTKMLAAAACDSQDPRFADFSLSEAQWEELHIAAWLHDCGKVTTPEYVVDKATKLETICDRIHEIRMRFEVLKRDAEIEFWQGLAEGGDRAELQRRLDLELARLDDDFEFVAGCNQGGEFMAPERLERLNAIATQTWRRTLSDRIGISWEEGLRKQREPEPELPVEESLIADKQEHVFERDPDEIIAEDNPWNFRLDTPEHRYNKGELYNLSVARGTLAPEERFKINDHMVQTIVMLNQLPFPRHLRKVPEIAGGHHETMIGTGYPKKLRREDMSLSARMMAIADIFEALTAADRPYKKAKSLSESIRIMSFMKKDQHIDPDLFELFLHSGVYLDYARRFLNPEQIDEVDIAVYLETKN